MLITRNDEAALLRYVNWVAFDARVHPQDNGCWLWTGSLNVPTPAGYGAVTITVDGRKVHRLTHRLSYVRHRGQVPEGLVLDHLCRTPQCCNPDHLEPVTQRANVLRGVGRAAANKAKTHCLNGHELSGANVYLTPKHKARQCVTCQRVRDAAAYQRRLERRSGKSSPTAETPAA
jgi:hypothetical protein